MSKRKVATAGIIVCLLWAGQLVVLGQDAGEGQAPVPVAPPIAPVAAVTPSATPGRMQFDLEMPLGAFLRLITETSGMRFVTTAELAKRDISLYLPEATPKEALDVVCAAYDLSYEASKESNVIVVKDSQDSAVIYLEHVNADDISGLLPTILIGKSSATIDKKNNVVVIKGSRMEIAKFREAVAAVDKTPAQVLIEATLAELTNDAERRLGIRWDLGGTFRGAARETKAPFDFDYVSLEDSATAWTYGILSFQDTLAMLEASERDGGARILATPRIAALHNTEANIKIVTHQVIAVNLTRETGTVNLVTETPIFADVGVELRTVPRIHRDNSVTLVVEPSVSTAAPSLFVANAVDTFNRSALTTVLLKDGQTFAIGGLLRDDTNTNERRIPYFSNALRKIPFFGRLFRHNTDSETKVDLVMFLTPKIMTPERIDQDAEENAERTNAAAANVKKQLPVIGRGSK
jgi:Flp pilus assembly secretin CpaC